jgi:predicted nucleotidyltransferase
MLAEKVESNLAAIRATLEDAGAVLAYLFGSAAKGTDRSGSDLDIAVLLGPEVPAERYGEVRLRLLTDLVGLTHTDDVDLALLNIAPPLLAFEIITTGRLLLGSRRQQVRFEIEANRRYIDTRPLRQFLGEDILRRIREGARDLKESQGKW